MSYMAPYAGAPGASLYPSADMLIRYDSAAVLENSIWGDGISGLTGWPVDGVFAYLAEVQDGIEVLADLVLTQDVDGVPTAYTLSYQNYPALRWTHEGLPVYGDLISEGNITTSSGVYFARVYRYSYLSGSPLGWTAYTWYAEIDGKFSPVAVVVSNNGDLSGAPVSAFTRCTVFDLGTALVY